MIVFVTTYGDEKIIEKLAINVSIGQEMHLSEKSLFEEKEDRLDQVEILKFLVSNRTYLALSILVLFSDQILPERIES